MKLGSGKIWRFAERWASGGIGVGETREPKSLTETASSSTFHIDQRFGSSSELEACIERQDHGCSLFRSMLETIRTAVFGRKPRMPLKD